MKRTSKSFRFVVALVLVISLSFPMSFNAYALTDGNGDGTSTSSNSFNQNFENLTTPEAPDTSPEAIKAPLTTFAVQDLEIESVQVVNGGEEQARYRDFITTGAIETDKYYTAKRTASMTDARIFKVSTTISSSAIGLSDADTLDVSKLSWTYDGKSFNEWKQYKPIDKWSGNFDGNPAISLITQSAIINANEGSITITAEILFDEFYPVMDKYTTNLPYEGYTAIKKEGFHSDQPLPIGTYDLAISYAENELAVKDITLNLYDSFHTWDQINETAIDLKAESERVDTENEKDVNVINGRYVSVDSLYTDNDDHSIWNVVIAKDAQSVTDYLTETKPMMQSNPDDLKAELDKSDALASGYHKIPIYFNNVHPDETPGSDAILELINTFIYEEDLSYETQIDSNHVDKGAGYDGYTIEGPGNQTKEMNFTVDEILDKFILVFNITENPYGKDNLVRTNEYGFDLNRDAAYQTQPEAIALTEDLVKWDALSMLEYHGYVDGLLIEPCTGPHDPNYEYDLYVNKMLEQGNALGKAMIGNTGYQQYLVPATDWNDGWDDGAPIYGPMFAMLYGTMGYTLEIPYTTEDSKDACYSAGLALAKDSLDNRLKYFRNKLTYKERCVNNEDSLDVDQYLIDPYTGEKIGRPRVDGQSFFPEYYVIPVDQINQRNPLEAYKMLQLLQRNGVDLNIFTTPAKYDNVLYPAGTYVVDMHQASRGFVNSMLSEGYDASNFAAIYAELVINHPDMRNFDCTTVYEQSVFSGKINSVSKIAVPSTSISGTSEQVVIQNDNIDAIRLVNRLLNDDDKVSILTEDFGKAKKGDYVVYRADLAGNDDLLVYGSSLTGIPNYMEEIEEPNMTIFGYEDHSKYVLDLLEFTGDYNYVYYTDKIDRNTNVVIDFDDGTDESTSLIDDGIGYIGIGYYALAYFKHHDILSEFDCFIPDEETYQPYYEGLVNAEYSDDNLITANYDRTDAAYVMNGTYITSLPAGGEALITIDNDDEFYKAGWYPDHDVLQGKMLAVSGYGEINTRISADSQGDNGVPITLFANNIFSKAHAQHSYNMLANAIFLTASNIDSSTSEKPQIDATPGTQETPVTSLTVNLTFKADKDGTEGVELQSPKYKVTSSETEAIYSSGAALWTDTTSAAAITLPSSNGTYYIHAYAENSNDESTQVVFGPYCIAVSGGSGNGSHHSSSGTTTPKTTEPAITATPSAFTDISGHWAKASIEYVVGKKLFNGISNTLFGPENTMTKGMLVTVLGRAKGIDPTAYSKQSVFTDVPQAAYYAPYVTWAYENKIISGAGSGAFEPDKPVTRGEMAVIITNYMKYLGKGTTTSTSALNYADADQIDSWGLEGVQFVTANGLMTGTAGNNFDFDGLSTRAQVATVLERLMKLIEQ